MPALTDFHHHAQALKDFHFIAGDYRSILNKAKRGDVIYLDPPYPATSDTAFFNHYSADRFSHLELARECERLDSIGCYWIMSNASTRSIARLYKDFSRESLKQTRFVSCKKEKLVARELIIRGRCTQELIEGSEISFKSASKSG